ncbi:MAG: hypothetical protein KF687_16175 [Cyclobacteriaceae bacterium]|nr:hypothetical protein [Cyclobacteriaceae bacterium]
MRFFYYTFLVAASLSVFAQQVPVLERPVTITAHNERLDVFLKKLSQEAGCVFSYSASALDVSRSVSYSFEQQPTREILETVFDGNIKMKQKGVYVILTPAPKISKEVVIRGYVVDETSGSRISEATVYNPVTLRSVTTDEYGYFEYVVKKPTVEDYKLMVKKVDYTDTEILVPKKRSSFQKISIKVDKEKLNHVGESIAKPATRAWSWTKSSVASINLNNVRDTIHRTWQISFVPFVGTNRKLSGSVTNDWSFNIIGGYSAGTNKAEFGGVFNINTGNVKAFQAAGVFNLNGGETRGVQLGGMFNVNLQSTQGVQAGGFANLAMQDARGAQLAGFLNLTARHTEGAQVAGFANISKSINGTQVAAFVNIAKHVSGSQIGFLNIADSIRGVPVGFLSFVTNGYHTLELGADEVIPVNISFRTGVRGFYTNISIGVRPEKADSITWSFGYGVGTSPRILKKLYLNIEASANQVNKGNVEALNLVNRIYTGLEYQVARKFAIYAGPTLSIRVYDITYNRHPDLFTYYKPTLLSDKIYPDDNLGVQLWWGFKAGVRLF